MTRYYGAQHNLSQLIKTHLFIICPNNSGSTFLKNILSTSESTWNLAKEGQHTFGFAGPSTRQLGAGLIWSTRQEWIERLTDDTAYDWTTTRKAWYFCAFSRYPKAHIFVTKAPPFLFNVHLLQEHFNNARFIFMVRNPYPVIEGIYRRHRGFEIHRHDDVRVIAAEHVINCLAQQRKNIEQYPADGLFFTYEQMCDEAQLVEQKIKSWLPALADLKLEQKISVKQMYDEMLRNMNAQQIARLSHEDIIVINSVLRPHQQLLAYFGYTLME